MMSSKIGLDHGQLCISLLKAEKLTHVRAMKMSEVTWLIPLRVCVGGKR